MNLEEFQKEYDILQKKLSNLNKSGLSLNRKEFAQSSKRLAFLQEVIEKIKEKEEIEKNIKENKEISKESNDEELKKLAHQDIKDLKKKKQNLEKEFEEMLSPKEELIDKILMEIRAAAGGEEAALFARELFEMYQKFANKRGWQLSVFACHPTDLNGFKEISFEIKGKNAVDDLRYESGVHRVQRIPVTEKSGRIHTSTISVAVLPTPKEKDIDIKPQDLRIEVYHSSGPGGQYVNKRESAVRVTHLPTGLVATSQSARTQVSKRENALKILNARLYQKQRKEEEKKIGAKRKSQIGTGERAEKIRTYNFPQDRITDHRVKKSWKHIEEILAGNLEKIVGALKAKLSQ